MSEQTFTGTYDEFNDHVKSFDTAFKCHPPSKEEIAQTLASLLGIPPFSLTQEAIDYVHDLHRRALFGNRLGLIVEELGEWTEAVLKDHSIEEQAKELADVQYVVMGAADTLSIPMEGSEGALVRVMTKNQVKIDNASSMRKSASGKIIKPEDQR